MWATWVKNAVAYHLRWLFSLGPELWISRAVWSAFRLFEGKFRHELLYVIVINILVAWPQVASQAGFFFLPITQSSSMVRWARTRDIPLRTSAWEARHQAPGDPLTSSSHRLLAILAFFPQTENLFTGQSLANFNWRAKANTKEIFPRSSDSFVLEEKNYGHTKQLSQWSDAALIVWRKGRG